MFLRRYWHHPKTRGSPSNTSPLAVHPHASGEDTLTVWARPGLPGSPPREWGRRYPRARPRPGDRFTPTRVGKTSGVLSGSGSGSVHPHASGEDGVFAPLRERAFGSPPREWGRLRRIRSTPRMSRFTPTRVGKTRQARNCRTCSSVHPHASGEDAGKAVLAADPDGSPPREWGRRHKLRTAPGRSRFTPTRVGKTSNAMFLECQVTVHPHASGEDVPTRQASGESRGSPPREWGRHSDSWAVTRHRRFTPTRVGKTV